MSELSSLDECVDAVIDTELDTGTGMSLDSEAEANEETSRRTVREWMQQRTVPQVLISAAVLLYTSYFTTRSLDIHHGLGTSSYDSALYDQGMWLLSRGKAPFVTLMGRNLFGDHTSFVLIFLVPLYWIAPGAWIMFFAQSAAIGAGAIPIFLYGRKRLGTEWLALIPAAAYLLHPAVGWTNLENFHPDAFLGVFVGFAIYGALERKWTLYAAFVVLSLMVKEDVSLVIVPLGVWVAIRRDRRAGLLTIFGALAFMATAMFVVMRGLIGVPTRNSWRIPFGGPRGVIDTAITNPTDLADHLRSENRPWYIWQMTSPFAWMFARLPDVALISGLVLFTNILSTFWYQYQVEYHYGLVAVPALGMGSVYAMGALRDRIRVVAVGAVAGATLLTSVMWSPVPWGRIDLYYGQPDNIYATTMRELIPLIPADASVAAHYRVTPHIAHREEIYQFPTPFRVELYGPDETLNGTRLDERANGIDYVMLPTSEDENVAGDWAVVSSAFEEVAANDFWVLYKRNPAIALPPAATDVLPAPAG